MAIEAVANPPLVVVPQPPSPAHDRVIRLAHHFQRCCLRLRFANTVRTIWERRLDDITSISIQRRDARSAQITRCQEFQYTINEEKLLRFFDDHPEIAHPLSWLLDLKLECDINTPPVRARHPWHDDEQVNRLWTQFGSTFQVDEASLRWYILCTEREILGPEYEVCSFQATHDDVHSTITVLLRSLTHNIRLWELERVRLRRSLYNANGELNRVGPPSGPLLAVAELL
jgi:hypothetical protein